MSERENQGSQRAAAAIGVLGLAQGFVGIALAFADTTPNKTLLQWLLTGAALCVLAAVGLWFRRTPEDNSIPVVHQEGSENTQIVGGRDAIAQSGVRNVVVQEGGEYYEAKERKEGDEWVVDIGPEVLIQIYRDHTTVQANRLFGAFKGKRMRVSGRLRDVSPVGERLSVSIDPDSCPEELLVGMFPKKAGDRLEALPRGSHMTLVGTIDRVYIAVVLEDAELEEVGPIVPQP